MIVVPFSPQEFLWEDSRRLVPYTVAVFTDDGLDDLSFFGSGTLVEVGPQRFVVVAAHMIPLGENTVLVGIAQPQVVLAVRDGQQSPVTRVKTVSLTELGGLENKTADIRIFQLDHALAYDGELSEAKYVTMEQLWLGALRPDCGMQVETWTVLTGFKRFGGPGLDGLDPLRCLTRRYEGERGPVSNVYEDVHHLVHWDDLGNPSFTSEGMSGGGVWVPDHMSETNRLRYKLAGITTTWDPAQRVSISVRAQCIVDMFATLPALRPYLPVA